MRPAFLAAFGEQQLLVGPGVVQQLHVVEVVLAVPVEAGAPDVFGRFGVAVNHAGALDHCVAVVVPHDDAHVAQARSGQLGAEKIAHEIAFLFGRVQTRVPALARLWFVLD